LALIEIEQQKQHRNQQQEQEQEEKENNSNKKKVFSIALQEYRGLSDSQLERRQKVGYMP
jgi:hypothetical protein